jgi:hypothetical protein
MVFAGLGVDVIRATQKAKLLSTLWINASDVVAPGNLLELNQTRRAVNNMLTASSLLSFELLKQLALHLLTGQKELELVTSAFATVRLARLKAR